MRVHKLHVTVPSDHRLAVQLPEDFPAGPAEVIVLAARAGRRIVALGGVLGGQTASLTAGEDPIGRALDDFRAERRERIEAGPEPEVGT